MVKILDFIVFTEKRLTTVQYRRLKPFILIKKIYESIDVLRTP